MAIEVWNRADLDNVRNNLSGDYIQMANIDLSDSNWSPIDWDGSNFFYGSYNGNGYTISNMTVSGTFTLGLFASTEGTASLRNINLRDVYVSGSSSVGGLVGSNYGNIYGCSVTGDVRGYLNVGLLAGANDAAGLGVGGLSVERCWTKGSVATNDSSITDSRIGGLIGYIAHSDIPVRNCYSGADVTFSELNGGGLIGRCFDGAVYHCYSYGIITAVGGSPTSGGGVIGSASAASTLTNIYYDADRVGYNSASSGTPRTTAEMTYPENFTTTYINWDFTNIWTHDPTYTINDGYPPFGAGFNIWVKKSGAWQPVTDIWARKGGAWQPVSSVDVNKDGWKPI